MPTPQKGNSCHYLAICTPQKSNSCHYLAIPTPQKSNSIIILHFASLEMRCVHYMYICICCVCN